MATSSNQTPKLYWIVAAILLSAIVAVGGWKLWGVLNPPSAATAAIDPTCDLQAGECRSSFPDGTEVSLSILPSPVPVLKELTLSSTISGIEANKVEVDIVGINMNMGYIRPELKRTDSQGLFTGESILPVCILNEMEWEARVMVHSDDGLLVAPFRFITRKNYEQK